MKQHLTEVKSGGRYAEQRVGTRTKCSNTKEFIEPKSLKKQGGRIKACGAQEAQIITRSLLCHVQLCNVNAACYRSSGNAILFKFFRLGLKNKNNWACFVRRDVNLRLIKHRLLHLQVTTHLLSQLNKPLQAFQSSQVKTGQRSS